MLSFTVRGQLLTLKNSYVAASTLNYLTAEFDFKDHDWDGLQKWAHFSKGEEVYDMLIIDDVIPASSHLNLSEGLWSVYIHGAVSGKRITTGMVRLKVHPTGILNGSPLPEMVPMVQEQLAAAVANAVAVAEGVRSDADNGLFRGPMGKSAYTLYLEAGGCLTVEEFSEALFKICPSVYHSAPSPFIPADNGQYRLGTLASLSLCAPELPSENYGSEVFFTSGTVPTDFSASGSFIWKGEGISNGVFTPAAGRRYGIKIENTGGSALIATVRTLN